MCGIIGYIGKKDAFPILISGLKRMEYRGYDSYGFCVLKDKETPFLYKKTGKISEAEETLLDFKVKGLLGIGHSRWATHGGVTDVNAHPHFDCRKNIFVVHNGSKSVFDRRQKFTSRVSREKDTAPFIRGLLAGSVKG